MAPLVLVVDLPTLDFLVVTSLPHATATGQAVTDIAACVGLLCLLDGVPEGHSFSSLPLAARGRWECYMVNMGSGCLIRDNELNET